MKMLSSYHQQRLWFIDHFEKDDLYEGGPVYHNIPLFLRIGGAVNHQDLCRAVLGLMELHQILRTKLTRVEGDIFQEVSAINEIEISGILLPAENLYENQETLRQVPFTFEDGHLLKIYYELSEDYTDVFFVIHHAIADGYSLEVLERQFLALVDDETVDIAKGPQFQDFSNWQNALTEEDLESLMFHWKSKLKDLQVLYFATDQEREQVHIYQADQVSLTLDNRAVLSYSEAQGLTARTLILAAYKMAFARLTGLSDIVIGTFMDLRNEAVSNLVGPVENLVVLRSLLDKEKPLSALCELVDREWKEAEMFKTMPFDKLVTLLNPKKDMSRTALFDVLYAYRETSNIEAGDAACKNQGWGKYDFNLLVTATPAHFELSLTFNRLYFSDHTVKALLELVERILTLMVTKNGTILKNIPLLSVAEQKKLIKKNSIQKKENTDTLISRLLTQVAAQQGRSALSWSSGEMSYADLDLRSNQLANFLTQKYQLGREDKVAVIMSKSAQLIVVILAILKSGAAYVPIDPAYPEERRAFMIEDASCKLVIDQDFLNQNAMLIAGSDTKAMDTEIVPGQLAYIIYTSGTTGRPKGVMIEHGHVISLLDSCFSLFSFSEKDVWTFFHSYCFDFSIWEIFGCLLSGGKLLVLTNEESRNQELVADLIHTHQVTIFSQTPSAFYNFITIAHQSPSLRYVVFGGEALHPFKLKQWSESNPEVKLVNMYGITETTVHVTFKLLSAKDLSSPLSNIGKALSFADIYILDADQHVLPYGRPGEMYVAGRGVARGYLNRPDVNAERFINCPFDAEGDRLYRTGDMVRLLASGELEYLGRIDDQVKVRGYRIELDEIKKQLDTCPGVLQSAISLVEMPDGDKSIVAYVAVIPGTTIADVKVYISGKIPEYMVPSFIIKMDHIPINENGKVDKTRLPSPLDHLSADAQELVPPSNEIEARLFSIWAELLNTNKFGIKHNFFEMGGHSLKATRLVTAIHREFQVRLELKQLFSNPVLDQQARLIASSQTVLHIEIPKVEKAESYPVSDGQKRLWILSKLKGAAVAYHMPFQVTLDGSYAIALFKKALDAVIERHEMLRTVFREDEEGELRQWIKPAAELNFKLDYLDFTEYEDKEQPVKDYIRRDIDQPFHLSEGPLIRASLLKIDESRYIFYYNLHHIIGDGWSMEVLTKDVLYYYHAFKNKEEITLKPLKIQYKDFVAWRRIQNDEQQSAYWNDKMSGKLPVIDLPSQKVRPQLKTYNGTHLSTFIGAEDTRLARRFIEEKGGSLFMLLTATWNLLMYRYTAQEDIVIGTAVAGRPHDDLADQIGFYVNTLALRNRINPESDFNALYQSVKENTLEAFEHQMYPFDRLVGDLKLTRDNSRNAIFDIMLILQNAGERSNLKIEASMADQVIDKGKRTSKFDMDIFFQDMGEGLSFNLIYNNDVYEEEMAEALMRHFKLLLKNVITDGKRRLREINFLSAEEQDELLLSFNDTDVRFPAAKTLAELFEEQVRKNQNAVALVFEDQVLSYGYLNELSNRFADYLKRTCQLKRNEIVGLKLERSVMNVVALIGVLKMGGCCCPIDPETPVQRLKHISDNCKVVIDQQELNLFLEEKELYGTANPLEKGEASDLAYIVHTSGSSGIPKGCMLEHKGIVNHVFHKISSLGINTETVLCHTSKFYFVGGIWQLWAMLIAGGRLLVTNNEELQNTSLLLDKVVENEVKILEVIPSQLNNVFSLGVAYKLKGIDKLILTGEKLNPSYVNRFFDINSGVEVINTYGQSECSDVTTSYTMHKGDLKDRVLIGKPIQNIRMYVLDQHLQLCPKGVIGELYTSGAGVCRGYLNQMEQSLSAFIENPFTIGSSLYRTGDLGRWTNDGNLEILGRRDEQIKIRGHRIDLGEIENALLTHPEIREAVVVVHNEKSEDTNLAAYIATDQSLDNAVIKNYLKTRIPEYMHPLFYVQMSALPLTSNGKVNKKVLPAPTTHDMVREGGLVAAKTDLEHKLVKIWKKLLNLHELGIREDFFALGGHSLKATRLLSEYHKQFNVRLRLEDIFVHTTIEAQALLLTENVQIKYKPILKATESQNYVLSAGQRRLWVLSQFEEGSLAYNMPFHVDLQGAYYIPDFILAINATIERHEILRTVFRKDGSGELRQWVLSTEELGFQVDCQDFSQLKNKKLAVKRYLSEDAKKPFDLENGPLLRAALLQIDTNDYVFYYNLHHIIGDGWSMNILVKDVLAYYKFYNENGAVPLEKLNIQYKDYAVWQREQFNSFDYLQQKEYWMNKLSGDLPRIDLPGNKLRPKLKTNKGEMLSTYISAEELQPLRLFVEKQGGSLFMGLLSLWNILLYKYTAQKDILVGTPVAGREQAELEDQIGFYVNTLVLRNQINPEQSFAAFYAQVKASVLADFANQGLPFDNLVESLKDVHELSRNSIFDIILVLQNTGEKIQGIELAADDLDNCAIQDVVSKFDLEIIFKEVDDFLDFKISYHTDLYDRGMVEGLMLHFKGLLKVATNNPELSIASMDYLSKSEKDRLQYGLNDTRIGYPKDRNIIDLFEEQVSYHAERIAIDFEGQKMSYQNLSKLSSQFAHYLLKNYDIHSEDLIGIKLERSDWAVTAILAVLKTGAAYVPVDPAYPVQRIEYMMSDSNCGLMIDLQVIADFMMVRNEYPVTVPELKIMPENLAYVMYTSGSTGKPKGVMIEHRSVVSLVKSADYYTYSVSDCLLATGALSFDATTFEFFGMLLNGGKLVICSNEILLNIDTLSRLIKEKSVNVMWFTAGWLNQLVDQDIRLFADLKTVFTGGDKLSPAHISRLRDVYPDLEIINGYGPTENTTFSLTYNIKTIQGDIPVGYPVSNSTAYIFDEHENFVPVGVTGEIYVGGDGLARGYLNRPELTAQKFTCHAALDEERLYKTGDLGKWSPDGFIEFEGRKDNQLKVRGHRVELGEIAFYLSQKEGMKAAVVELLINEDQEKELIGYFVSETMETATDLRTYLLQHLPEYMVPGKYMQLKELPLDANGKLDRKSLINIENEILSYQHEYVAPVNAIEEKLVAIWQEVLHAQCIGTTDNFFELGGHSIKAIKIIAQVNQEFNVEINMKNLFLNPTIAHLAAQISFMIKQQETRLEIHTLKEIDL